MMSDTCITHRSRVPWRSSGSIKGGATTVQDERGPGLDFNLCFVCVHVHVCMYVCMYVSESKSFSLWYISIYNPNSRNVWTFFKFE